MYNTADPFAKRPIEGPDLRTAESASRCVHWNVGIISRTATVEAGVWAIVGAVIQFSIDLFK